MAPLRVEPPLRILAMVVSPSDLPELDVERERQRLETALGPLSSRGLVEVVWMQGGTTRDLQQALWKGPWHIFHFVGHGGFDDVRGEGVVVMANEKGTSQPVSATNLGRLLGDHDPLRLAVLNACDSARGDALDVFSSTAATLVRRGTPAVVAMQYEITDDAAIEFSRDFYEALAGGIAVDEALAEARKGVALAIPGTLEWGTPVLFMRTSDGILFDIPKSPAPRDPATATPVALTTAATATDAPARSIDPPVAALAAPAPQDVSVATSTPPASAGFPGWSASSTVRSPKSVAQPATAPAGAGPGPTARGNRRGVPLKAAIPAAAALLLVVFALGRMASGESGGGGNDFFSSPPDSAGGVVPPDTSDPTPPADSSNHAGGTVTTGILFANNGRGSANIFRIAPDGGEPVAITSGQVEDRSPSWSPDGSTIAFAHTVAGRPEIWLMDADGQNERSITSSFGSDIGPRWSPDGSRLAFTRVTADGHGDIWTVNADGTNATEVTSGPAVDVSPAWSPDGSSILFTSNRDATGIETYLYTYDVATGDIVRRTLPDPSSGPWIDGAPAWSAGGDSVLFARSLASAPTRRDVWEIQVPDWTATMIDDGPTDDASPVYGPGDQTLVFCRLVGANFHLFIGDANGVHDLTANLAGNSCEPSWR
jgi:Tol biopolymer transport system component